MTIARKQRVALTKSEAQIEFDLIAANKGINKVRVQFRNGDISYEYSLEYILEQKRDDWPLWKINRNGARIHTFVQL